MALTVLIFCFAVFSPTIDIIFTVFFCFVCVVMLLFAEAPSSYDQYHYLPQLKID